MTEEIKKDKKKKHPPMMGDNIRGLYDVITESTKKIEQWKKEKKVLLDNIKAEREKIEANGVTKKGYDIGRKINNMDPEERKAVLMSICATSEALGEKVDFSQFDMFKKEHGIS